MKIAAFGCKISLPIGSWYDLFVWVANPAGPRNTLAKLSLIERLMKSNGSLDVQELERLMNQQPEGKLSYYAGLMNQQPEGKLSYSDVVDLLSVAPEKYFAANLIEAPTTCIGELLVLFDVHDGCIDPLVALE